MDGVNYFHVKVVGLLFVVVVVDVVVVVVLVLVLVSSRYLLSKI